MRPAAYCSPWWPGDLPCLDNEQLRERNTALTAITLQALAKCQPRRLEQDTVDGATAHYLELCSPAARADSTDSWEAWLETEEEAGSST